MSDLLLFAWAGRRCCCPSCKFSVSASSGLKRREARDGLTEADPEEGDDGDDDEEAAKMDEVMVPHGDEC